jgi:hypothetical protein
VKGKRDRETYLEIGGGCQAYKVLPLLPFWTMAELGWSVSEVTQEHLKNLMGQGYMIATELATCRVPENPASPIPAGGGGYIMVCMAFYERGFSVPSY